MSALLSIAPQLGIIAMVMSLAQLLPIGVSLAYSDGTTSAFVFSMAFNCAAGYVVWVFTHRYQRDLGPRDGFLLVTLAWTGGAAFATLPLLIAIPDLSVTDASSALSGTVLGTDHSSGLVAVNATLGFGLSATAARPFVQALWDLPVPTGTYRYYNGLLYMLSLLHASGKFQLWF